MTNPLRIAARLRSAPLFALAILAASSTLLVAPRSADAQTTTSTVVVRVTADSLPISGATIATGITQGVSDRSGVAAFTVPTGRRTFRVTSTGFLPESLAVDVDPGIHIVTIALHHQATPPRQVVPSQKAAPQQQPAPQHQLAPQQQPAPQQQVAPPKQLAPQQQPAPQQQVAPPKQLAPQRQVEPPPQTSPARQAALPDSLVAITRDGRRLSDQPTSVEIIDRDALEEQIDRSPGTISELLARAGGVRMQPLSAGSAGEGIRIRGMPGHYAKILSDGLPLFGAAPEGLDALQTPALDLQRVEITKGVTSALYGPEALSGVVNLVSAPPTSPSQVVVNGSTLKGSDVAIWQTHTFTPQWAATLVAGRQYQNSGDLDGDGWSEVNGYKRINVRPRVYWSRSDRSSWFMTGGWLSENRRSGTFGNARLPDFNRFSDDADTRRADGGTVGRIVLDTNTLLTVRASLTREWRTRWFGEDREGDRRNMIFSDVALTKSLGENVLVGGVALERDQYTALGERGRSYRYTTPALFAEHTWTPESWFGVTSSARVDLQSEFGDFVSPRVSIFVRPSDTWTMRLSRAAGVYAPTPLTDETEAIGLAHLRSTPREAEHATGWSLDVGRINGLLELRGSAYRTVVNHPVVLRTVPGSLEDVALVNADDPTRTQGIDLYVRYRGNPFRYTATYSYIDATRPEIAAIIGEDFEVDTTLRRVVPLNPRHAVSLDAAYERENDRVIGLDVRFTGRQVLADTLFSVSRAYVTLDARLEKHVGPAIFPVILFVRGKNLTGVRQTQFAPLVRRASGFANQWTNDVWAPLDGRALNAGLRVKY
jgi:iron complex outermembrane receptor protein